LANDYDVVTIDNLNAYYDVELKHARLKDLPSNVTFEKIDLVDKQELQSLFERHKFSAVVNLAAQAGVRFSKKSPDTYVDSNVTGFYNIITLAKDFGVEQFIYASSSSVYGANDKLPFSESDPVNTPMSIYAATKKTNEDIASAFTYTFGLPTIGLRFFTVYGRYGRPDMSYYLFADALANGTEIELRENGEMWRDFTYVGDVSTSIKKLLEVAPKSTPEIFNIGNKTPHKVADVLDFLAKEMEATPNIVVRPKGPEEPVKTWADTSLLQERIGFAPDTDFYGAMKDFVAWFKEYSG
jgi:UDP-glucuronate 4-epimerase